MSREKKRNLYVYFVDTNGKIHIQIDAKIVMYFVLGAMN
jgi:hypothetical protein